MRIGFCGAHRTGKTTLARAVAQELELPLLESKVSEVARKCKFNMAIDNRITPFGLDYQAHVLASLVKPLTNSVAGITGFVYDRTPIDAAAYMLCDATASAGSPETREFAMQYVDECRKMTRENFDIIFLVPPGIAVEETDGKPPVNPLYQEHHHHVCAGLLLDTDENGIWYELSRKTLDLDARLDFVLTVLAEEGFL